MPGSGANLFATNGGGSLNVNNNILYFPQGPITSTNVNSYGEGATPADAAANGCQGGTSGTANVGTVGTFDLTTLGFQIPFKAK